jgi:tryptophan 2,3-dioxygenase
VTGHGERSGAKMGGEMTDDPSVPILPGNGASDYERYLRTDELLALQTPPEQRVHRDELLFQTVHQTSELWLKLAVSEVDEAARRIDADQPPEAARVLRRAVLGLDFVTDAMTMLDLLDPWDYHQVRTALGHGSGFDSPGFRELTRAIGLAGGAFERRLARAGVEDLTDVYRRRADHPAEHELAELLTDLDERFRVWRVRHYQVVVRALGDETMGIQGTPVAALPRLIGQHQLPDLWAARSRLARQFDQGQAGGRPVADA